MARKVLNNKIEFIGSKSVTIKLSDNELKDLREYSNFDKGTDLSKMNMASINNFSLYAFLDYTLKGSSKACRVKDAFPYHDFNTITWFLA